MSDESRADEAPEDAPPVERPPEPAEPEGPTPPDETTEPVEALSTPSGPDDQAADTTDWPISSTEGEPSDDPAWIEEDREVESDWPASILEAIERLGTELGGQIEGLRASFERELRAEASREKVVDRLHSELQEYRNDLLLKITRPIFIDLIQLHDDMGKMAESLEDERATRCLADFRQGIEDVLYRQGVEPFLEPGERFDPRRQRAVSTVATDEPERNKVIAARLRPGFAIGEKIIRPELVSVFALRRTPDAGAETGADET